MPPSVVRSVKDVIFWQYAKLIAKSAGFDINQRAFQMDRFIKLRDGKLAWSTTVREWVKEQEKPHECIYCGSTHDLSVEHILPRCCGGPDIPDNVIHSCKTCNSSKGGKRLYEWYGEENRDEIPRIAEGKYLKLLYELHEKNGTLNIDKAELTTQLCPRCDFPGLCKEEGHDGRFSVYCLEGIFLKK